MKAQGNGFNEVVSLAERMGWLQALRFAFAAVVLLSVTFAKGFVGAEWQDLALTTAAYVGITILVEGLRRVGRVRGLFLIGGMLLLDGLYLAWVTYQTGGTGSALRFLVHIHLIAVTLLASYKTGLKIALWHTLLLFVVFHAQLSGILQTEGGPIGARTSIFNVLAFWLVAIGTAAFSSLNEREIRRRNVDLEALHAMAAELQVTTEAPDVARTFLEATCSTFGFKRGFVLAGPEGRLEMLATHEVEVPDDLTLQVIDSVIETAWDEREPVPVKRADAGADRVINRLIPDARNLVVVPLLADGQRFGAVVLEYGTGRSKIERRILMMVNQFASLAVLELRNAWLLERVHELARTDELSSLPNRRAFEEALQREVERARRDGTDLTLVMVDIDHFKSLNDTYGHPAGDDVLRQTGALLKEACRTSDVPARYGGEEFAVLMPVCSSGPAKAAAGRIRKLISDVEFDRTITASAGVATYPLNASSAEELLKIADDALYEAKRQGRNRLVQATIEKEPSDALLIGDQIVETAAAAS